MALRLVPQSYGIAMAQGIYGGPRGVWLECTVEGCDNSDRIAGPRKSFADAEAAAIFRAGGWHGEGDRMLKAQCPRCSEEITALRALAGMRGG